MVTILNLFSSFYILIFYHSYRISGKQVLIKAISKLAVYLFVLTPTKEKSASAAAILMLLAFSAKAKVSDSTENDTSMHLRRKNKHLP